MNEEARTFTKAQLTAGAMEYVREGLGPRTKLSEERILEYGTILAFIERLFEEKEVK